MTESEPQRDEQQDAIVVALMQVMNDYLDGHCSGVRVDVVQAALGTIITASFAHFEDRETRLRMLDNFCTVLCDSVEEMDEVFGVEPTKRVLS